MDTNNSEATTSGEATTVVGDQRELWQLQLQPASRQRVIAKIMDTLKKHLPYHGQEGLNEIRMIAVRFEEKVYAIASSQTDYLRRISLKMHTLESQSRTVCVAGKRKRVMAP
ncbi:mediator of RNA polymerase II transcription subunit 15a [Herrania umbratica]|uniref:Mediator of RNA polymerase II transcription subunit 15a n=1 Tax=Herrania umbratica TaxID=108875 RepID=A0A6J1BGU4_9ROSI|nr:mediator of RNA polymerase II transcription subunit 15a [Herrania umbratica]